MAARPRTTEQLQRAVDACALHEGNVAAAARSLGMSRATLQAQLDDAQQRGVVPEAAGWTFSREKQVWLDTGTMIVTSDHHHWPDERTVAFRAALAVIEIVKPRLYIANGDVFDGGSISRHPPFGWAKRPSPIDELHACQERLGEIEQAVPNGCELLWNLGNHDIRWERTLATQVEQFAGLTGLRLADHFPAWEFQWSALVNGESRDPVMVFHNYANGIHAPWNNALKGGMTVVTGHTHKLGVTPVTDLRGRRYGVETGTLANLNSAQFEYQGNRPSLACSGFAVLTFRDGRLLPPELCEVIEDKAYFRGEVVA